VAIGHRAHHNLLAASERPLDLELVALVNEAMRFRRLPVDRNLSALARFLGFRSRPEETRHVKPDIKTNFGAHDCRLSIGCRSIYRLSPQNVGNQISV